MENINKGDKSIEEKASERVVKAQEKKEFKDTNIITYTRKYKAALEIVTSKDLEEIEKDKVSAYKLIEKSKVWPKFDIEQLKEQRYSSGYCYFITKLRESLTNKPIDDEKARRMYVILVETILPVIKDCRELDDLKERLYAFYRAIGATITKELEHLRKRHYYNEEGYVDVDIVEKVTGKSFINLVKLSSDSAKNNFIAAYLYNEFTQEQRDKFVSEQKGRIDKQKMEFISNSEIYRSKTQSGVSEQIKKAIFYEIFSRSAPDEINFESFYAKMLEYYDGRISDFESRLSPIYTVRPEKWDWYYDKGEKKEGKQKDVPKFKSILEEYGINVNHKLAPLSHIKRTNGLKLPEIAVKSIVDILGFKDVVYGNYVRDKESEVHTKYFISAILDMAEILNMDIKQLNKAGGLSIFFGALGCGAFSGAFACYYPSRKAINLTKKNGDGCVSHEWGHFFDNLCSEGLDVKAIPTYATELSSIYLDNPEIKKCFSDIVSFWDGGLYPETKTIMKTFYGVKGEVPAYHLYGDSAEEAIENIQKKHPSYRDYYKVIGNLDYYRYYSYMALKFGVVAEGVASMSGETVYKLSIPLEVSGSYFKYISSEYDLSRGKKYYTDPSEMFARCFEAYVFEKMKIRNIENNYLCEYAHNYVNPFTGVQLKPEWIPYPYGEELERIVELYDKLMVVIKQQFFIGDFVWDETSERESTYVEVENTPAYTETKKGIVVEEGGENKTAEEKQEEVTIENVSENTEGIVERIELIQEMLIEETDEEKIWGYNERIELLREMLNSDQEIISQSKAEIEVEAEEKKDEIIEATKMMAEKVEISEDSNENAASQSPITSNFKIDNVENNDKAEKKNIFEKELNYDTRKVLNRAEDIKIPEEDVMKIENEGVTIEYIESLNTPVFKYRTQITLHGDFSGLEKDRFGGYKVLILNQNNTLGVKYTGIDIEKKMIINKCIHLSGSEWAFNHNSKGTSLRQMYIVNTENLQEIRNKCVSIFNSIPEIYIGDKYFNIVTIAAFGTFAILEVSLNAIYEKNLWEFVSFLTNGKISSKENMDASLEAEESAQKAESEKRNKEYAERAEKQKEELRPLIEKLKNSCPYPVLSGNENYKKYIFAKVVKDTYSENKVKIVLYYVERGLYFKRYVFDWNEINISFERKYDERRKKVDKLIANVTKESEKGLLYLVWFEPLPVRHVSSNEPKGTGIVSDKDFKFEIVKSKHTKTGTDIWIVKLKETLDRDSYQTFERKMKEAGGYYSSFVKGFVFKNEPVIV